MSNKGNTMNSVRKTVVETTLRWFLTNNNMDAVTVPAFVSTALDKATELESEIIAEVLTESRKMQTRGYSHLNKWFLKDSLKKAKSRWGVE